MNTDRLLKRPFILAVSLLSLSSLARADTVDYKIKMRVTNGSWGKATFLLEGAGGTTQKKAWDKNTHSGTYERLFQLEDVGRVELIRIQTTEFLLDHWTIDLLEVLNPDGSTSRHTGTRKFASGSTTDVVLRIAEPVADPPVVEVPVVDPPVAGPPVVELPVVDPPVAGPPVAGPPVVELPVVGEPTLAQADLTVELLKETYEDGRVTGRMRVSNVGSAASTSFVVRLVASKNKQPDPKEDIRIGTKLVPPLAPNQSMTVAISDRVDGSRLHGLKLIAVADSADDVVEVDEDNNVAVSTRTFGKGKAFEGPSGEGGKKKKADKPAKKGKKGKDKHKGKG